MSEEERPKLNVNERILKRIFSEIKRTPDVEIGGRFFGKIQPDGSLVVEDFIPTGPEPDTVSDVELLPDRRYQLWTLDNLRIIDSEIDLFGSWHSHIPNGLERFSRQDHYAYHTRMQPPYPHSGMLCGLIHTMPESIEHVREHLLLAWFPANDEIGVHSFYEPEEVSWSKAALPENIEQLIQLTKHEQYIQSTGRKLLTLDDWHRAINHIETTSVDPQHQIRQSPDGERLLIIEGGAGEDGFALEVSSNGHARCHLEDEEPTDWMTVSEASAMFERELHNWLDLPTEWSHLNRTLATVLCNNAEKSTIKSEKGEMTFLQKVFPFLRTK